MPAWASCSCAGPEADEQCRRGGRRGGHCDIPMAILTQLTQVARTPYVLAPNCPGQRPDYGPNDAQPDQPADDETYPQKSGRCVSSALCACDDWHVPRPATQDADAWAHSVQRRPDRVEPCRLCS